MMESHAYQRRTMDIDIMHFGCLELSIIHILSYIGKYSLDITHLKKDIIMLSPLNRWSWFPTKPSNGLPYLDCTIFYRIVVTICNYDPKNSVSGVTPSSTPKPIRASPFRFWLIYIPCWLTFIHQYICFVKAYIVTPVHSVMYSILLADMSYIKIWRIHGYIMITKITPW